MDGIVAARERLDPGLDVVFPSIDIRKDGTIDNVRRFRAALRALDARTMLTHNFGSIEWTIANRPALVRQVHVEDGFGPEERSRQLPRRVWLRRLFLRGRTVALPSQTLMRIALETWRLPKRQVHYVPNGIELARFAGPKPEDAWQGEGPLVGTVAALRPEKNVGRLIRAFARANAETPARLLLIGDGPERAALEALVMELGVRERVRFAGHVSQPAELIRSLDVFGLSSDTEQMPISLLEAMAAGVAVAATDVGDVAVMLPTAQRAFVVPCDDEPLARVLGKLIRDPGQRAALGNANQRRAADEYDEAKMFSRWATLLAV
jgi:glycosyltransferase involved in cell wall biosynthesis